MFGIVTIVTYEQFPVLCPVLWGLSFEGAFFGIVYIDLIVMLLLINLPYIILLLFTLKTLSHKILTFCFKPTVNIVKNILCNGFKKNVNAMN